MRTSFKNATFVLATLAAMILAGPVQAALLVGMDNRDPGSNHTLKGFSDAGALSWQVAAGNAKIGEVDPTDSTVIVAQGGTGVFTSSDVARYNAFTGAVVGTNPLFSHGHTNTRGVAVDPTTGDIVVASEGAAVAVRSAGTTTTYSTSFAGQSDALIHRNAGEDVLFVFTDGGVDALKGYLLSGPFGLPSTAVPARNAYPAIPGGGTYEGIAVYNDSIYVLKVGSTPEVWVYNELANQSAAPVQVSLAASNSYVAAQGITFDDLGNMYIADYGNGGDVYRYSPTGANSWGNELLLIDNQVPQATWVKWVVPEPSSLLILSAAIGMVARRRVRA